LSQASPLSPPDPLPIYAHGERLPPPVRARLRGRRVRGPGDRLVDTECVRRPAAAPHPGRPAGRLVRAPAAEPGPRLEPCGPDRRSEEHTSELQSRVDLV